MEKRGCLDCKETPLYVISLLRVFHVFHTIQMRCLCALIRYGYKRMCSNIHIFASIQYFIWIWVHSKNMCRCFLCVCMCTVFLYAAHSYSLAFFQRSHLLILKNMRKIPFTFFVLSSFKIFFFLHFFFFFFFLMLMLLLLMCFFYNFLTIWKNDE